MSITWYRPALVCLGIAAAVATTVASDDAEACGGCFHPETARSTVVTAHRMALSISPTQTVLWDQVRYDGTPSEFAWVLPIKPGARIEVATDAWFDTLDAATSTQVAAPPMNCVSDGSSGFSSSGASSYGDGNYDDGSYGGEYEGSGCNCLCGSSDEAMGGDGGPSGGSVGPGGTSGPGAASGSSGTGDVYVPPPPVTVVHEGTVGPYETVTLHANEEGALTTWLTDHGFAIDADIQPIIDAYADEGFDFIALRLAPDQGVQQMKPVRVVSQGAVPTLPLRMVAAGTGANVAITLFVIGEGRWQTANFPAAVLDPDQLVWDFDTVSSNYAMLRAGILDGEEGRTWLTSYAHRGPLLEELSIDNPLGGTVPLEYALQDGTLARTIAEAYFTAGAVSGEGSQSPYQCTQNATAHAEAMSLVVDTCVPAGEGAGGAGGSGGGGIGGDAGGGVSAGGTGGSGGATGGTGGTAEVCTEVAADQIDARDFACGTLDDLAVALTGTHPRDVWITRLEADLPRAALSADLEIEAAMPQEEAQHFHTPTHGAHNPCPLLTQGAVPAPTQRTRPTGRSRQSTMLLGIVLAVAMAALRRAKRSTPLSLQASRASATGG